MINDANNNFTDQELKFSYWYVTHKLLLRNIFVILLGLAGFFMWFYIVWQLVFLGLNYSLEQSQVHRLIFDNNPALVSLNLLKPVTIQISDPIALTSGDNRQDYFAEISNNNKNWLATFDYSFSDSEKDSNIRSGFVLPLEKKYLMNLGVTGPVAELTITNLKWQRISNPQLVYTDRYKFIIENEKFVTGIKTDDPNFLVFDITNNSAFNYWQVGVQTFLYGGGNVVSVNYIVLEQLKAGEKRQVQINWSGDLPRISNIQIIPEINIFDEANIMPQTAPTDFPISS